MEFESFSKKSYETQHFGFHPAAFLDEVYNTFYDNINEALSEMQAFLIQEYGNVKNNTPKTISAGTENLFKTMLRELDMAIDKLEIYIDRNVFKIPRYVTLPEDEVHITHPCTEDDEAKLDEEIKELRQKIQNEIIHQNFLKIKLAEQNTVLNELVSFSNQLQSIEDILRQIKANEHSTEELQSFFQLIENIKRKLNRYS